MSEQKSPEVVPSTSQQSKQDGNKIKTLEAQVKALTEQVDFLTETAAAKEAVKPSETPKDARREAIFAELREQIFLPGLGQLPKSMDCSPSSQQPKLRGMKLYATDYGLEVDLRGRTGFIPWGNVSWCVFKLLSKEEAKEADKNAGANSVVPGYTGPSKLGTATVTAK